MVEQETNILVNPSYLGNKLALLEKTGQEAFTTWLLKTWRNLNNVLRQEDFLLRRRPNGRPRGTSRDITFGDSHVRELLSQGERRVYIEDTSGLEERHGTGRMIRILFLAQGECLTRVLVQTITTSIEDGNPRREKAGYDVTLLPKFTCRPMGPFEEIG